MGEGSDSGPNSKLKYKELGMERERSIFPELSKMKPKPKRVATDRPETQ